jgi:hypothetical protein
VSIDDALAAKAQDGKFFTGFSESSLFHHN